MKIPWLASATDNLKFDIFSGTSMIIFSVALEIEQIFIDTSSTSNKLLNKKMLPHVRNKYISIYFKWV